MSVLDWHAAPELMSGLRVITSNRTEALVERLAAARPDPTGDPFRPELIVVQSRGMARWLQLELARRRGVSAHLQFPFPQAFITQLIHALVPDAPTSAEFAPEVLAWRIAEKIAQGRRIPGFESVDRYLSEDDDPRRRFQLAVRLAALFDEYLIYRPELIATWETGSDADWQAHLWRQLTEQSLAGHPARLQTSALERLRSGDPLPAEVPARVDIFGVSVLPPRYLELFSALAERREVTLYLLQPTPEYWGDLVSTRESQRQLRQAGQAPREATPWHFERGPRLLTALGKQGQDFLNTLIDHSLGAVEADECFMKPTGETLLAQLQADLFLLRDRTDPATSGPEKIEVTADDTSVQVHACHSPQRELEVLQDHLLAWFDADPSLRPEEVFAMTPDIEAYAPFIHAVFGHPAEEHLRIPYSVADRTPRAAGQLAEAFLAVLRVTATRMTGPQVLALLDCVALQRRFGFTAADLSIIRDWLRQLHVSWGLDAEHRATFLVPGWPTGTWRQAADALLLGYALAPVDEEPFADLAPLTTIEGAEAILAGRFTELVAAFEILRRQASGIQTPRRWVEMMSEWLDQFFAESDDDTSEFSEVRGALRRLQENLTHAGLLEPVPLALVVEALTPVLDAESPRGGFLRGGVTFCALKPMRAVPARVIAVLGLNDGSFPRRATRLGFDHIAAHPREGDSARGTEDRYLFLETLLCARDRLYLSYVGQSARDNTPRPPSVVVSELLDYVAETCAEGSKAVERLRVIHPLQAFSRRYFEGGDDRLFSYSREHLGAGETLAETRHPQPPFAPRPLPEAGPEWRTVRLEDLARFFVNPARFLVTKRLQISLPDTADPASDREVFDLDPRARYTQKQALTARLLERRSVGDYESWLRVSGQLPCGPAGELESRDLRREAEAFAASVRLHRGDGYLAPVDFELSVGGYRILGRAERVTAQGLLHFRCASRKPTDELRLWLEHLGWNAGPGTGQSARVVATDGALEFSPVPKASTYLIELLALYGEGLQTPLPFFPRSSFAFFAAERLGKKNALGTAQAQWNGGDFRAGEREDPYFNLCFRGADPDPLDARFAEITRRIWTPLFAHRAEVKP